MKCFIHINDEAIAVCKKCGKAMCGNCSAYTQHSGICPECKRGEYIAERNDLCNELSRNKRSIILSIIIAVIFTAVAIATAVAIGIGGLSLLLVTVIFLIRMLIKIFKRKPMKERFDYLVSEINKLNAALNRNQGQI